MSERRDKEARIYYKEEKNENRVRNIFSAHVSFDLRFILLRLAINQTSFRARDRITGYRESAAVRISKTERSIHLAPA